MQLAARSICRSPTLDPLAAFNAPMSAGCDLGDVLGECDLDRSEKRNVTMGA
jgi:hypothetical protein